MASTLGALNPIRYRGYVCDTETGLYYLQTRYYDPEVGRFINSDILVSTGQGLLGNNMFAYCRNNPVCRKDACGTDDIRVTDNNSNDNPFDDAGTTYRPGGASGGGDNSNGTTGNTTGKGFGTYGKFKSEIGSAGEGKQWHHIVEQNQITKSGFPAEQVHNTNNIVEIDRTTHIEISSYYSSKQSFSNGMTVREWLVGQSFEAQYAFGLEIMRRCM